MTNTLECLILGHLARSLKDKLPIEDQIDLAKTIVEAVQIHNKAYSCLNDKKAEQKKAFEEAIKPYVHIPKVPN